MKDFFEENKIDWSTIEEYEGERTLSGFCMALAECDKLLNYILTAQGYKGDTVFKKIHQAKTRFSDLSHLAFAMEIKENIFNDYEKEVSKDDIKTAIKYYRQAVKDLAESSQPDIGFMARIKAWYDYYLVYNPEGLKKSIIYFLVGVVILILLDTTNPGMAIVGFLVDLFSKIGKWLIILGIAVGVFLVLSVVVVIVYEKKNKGK